MTPATKVPWNELVAVERRAARPGPAKPRATITFGVVAPGGSLREPGRIREPRRVEERVLLVDAVVDHRDLDAFAVRAGQRRELR